MCIYIYIYIHTYGCILDAGHAGSGHHPADELALGKGHMGSTLMGSLRCSCFFLTGGTPAKFMFLSCWCVVV